MPVKPGRWCSRCKSVHAGKCPHAPVWEKPVTKQSGRGGRPWRRKRERIFERDGYLCQIHLRQGVEIIVTLHGAHAGVCDHKVPLSEGGTDDDENLQTICRACDKEKTQAESRRGRGGLKP